MVQYRRKRKNHNKRKTQYTIKELADDYKRNNWNKSWNYRLYYWIIEHLYPKTFEKVAKYNNYEYYIKSYALHYRGTEITEEQYISLKKLCPEYIDLLSEIKTYNIKGDFIKRKIREAKLERLIND